MIKMQQVLVCHDIVDLLFVLQNVDSSYSHYKRKLSKSKEEKQQ